jgi:ABC-type Fe3+/spermidine/putrescine transport system ATPase subunit
MTASDVQRSDALLEVRDLRVDYGRQTAVKELSFTVAPGEFVALLGPSGCGKTTTLRAIAGLEKATSGQILIDGVTVAGEGLHLPPEKRDLNMVFQSYAVWPHMTVTDNVSYGLKEKRLPKAEIAERTEQVLDAVGLGAFAKRFGTELSGGQQQRVALARALATRSKLILYDEPLSNLDASLRHRVRSQIMELHEEFQTTSIYVTHDQSEALSMADKVLVMKDGVLQQLGAPRSIYREPANDFVAEFVGVANLAAATATEVSGKRAVVTLDEHPGLSLVLEGAARMPKAVGEHGSVMFRPEDVSLAGSSTAAGKNVWPATTVRVQYVGPRMECELQVGDWQVRADFAGAVAIAPHEELRLSIDPARPVWIERKD